MTQNDQNGLLLLIKRHQVSNLNNCKSILLVRNWSVYLQPANKKAESS